jgi:hypothetical protein
VLFSGTVTLADDGSSDQIFDQDTNSPAPLLRSADNDTPSIVVSSVIVSEASPYAVLEVSLTNPSNFAVSFTPSLQSGSATIGADSGSTLEVHNGSTWEDVGAGQISLAAGVTSRLVRVAIANDSAYENSETFTINTGAISGPIANPAGASGTITIRDNGSSNNTFLASNTSATPTAGSADNDTPALQALSAAYLTRVVGRAMADMLALSAGVSEPDLAEIKRQAPLLVARAAEAEKLDWPAFLEQGRQWLLNLPAASMESPTVMAAEPTH